jgi:ribonucleoside-diphosphate reductase alpha chain
MLRHGMPIQSIMKIEDKCNGIITSFNKAIWKVLAKYVPSEDTEELCPQCGTGHIIRENGCEHCDSCGWSRCN